MISAITSAREKATLKMQPTMAADDNIEMCMRTFISGE